MLLRTLPDLAPENVRFREWFYSHWGRENCLIFGRTQHAEYARIPQRLSIKMAAGGSERYFLGGRAVAVDDDSYLVLNDGSIYGSLIDACREVESFSIFFRPGLVEEANAAMTTGMPRVLENPFAPFGPVEFPEQLAAHDSSITPIMRFIRHHLLAGVDDERWYEEQLQVLAQRLVVRLRRIQAEPLRLDCVKSSTRLELYRRLGLAADFILSNYARDIGLQEMAATACLSVHHFLRLFRSVHGITPMQFLYRKRIQAAVRLQRDEDLSAQDIAVQVGFNSRATYYRQLRRWQSQATLD